MKLDRSLAGIGRTQHAPGVVQGEACRRTPGSGAAFQALLESLESRAQDLRAQSAQVGDARALSGALDAARASLRDALELSDSLLEAVQQARQQAARGVTRLGDGADSHGPAERVPGGRS